MSNPYIPTFLMAIALALAGCGEGEVTHAHKVTFTVDYYGEIRSASAIQKVVRFTAYFPNGKPAPRTERSGGVSAVIDLGADGWLLSALNPDPKEWERRKAANGLDCRQPKAVSQFVRGSARPADLPASAPIELGPANLPAFIWIPKGEPYTAAVQICPEEFSRVIGASVKLVSVTREETPQAKVPVKLDLDATWLKDLRAGKYSTMISHSPDPFEYRLQLNQVEGEGW